ncbi:hypothetical protein ACLOJK_008988 [Asimina triloba]
MTLFLWYYDKAAFIFCVEDRALFCRDCDGPIHSPGSLSGNHQRLLATGIRVALSSACAKEADSSCTGGGEPPNHNAAAVINKMPPPPEQQPSPCTSPWADLLQFSCFESEDKNKESPGFGELEWISDIGLFDDQVPEAQEALAAAEVPQLPESTLTNASFYRPTKTTMSHKKPRIEISDDEFFTVPDLG